MTRKRRRRVTVAEVNDMIQAVCDVLEAEAQKLTDKGVATDVLFDALVLTIAVVIERSHCATRTDHSPDALLQTISQIGSAACHFHEFAQDHPGEMLQ